MSSAEEFGTKYPNPVAEDAENDGEADPEADSREVDESQLSIETLAKRKASPFTSTMDVALATAFTTEKSILDGSYRAEGVPTRQQKLYAWERIRDCVNAFSGDSNLKTVQQCKDRHRNLIQAVRFKRTSGFLEGPLPLPTNHQSQETNEQTNSASNQPSHADGTTGECNDAQQAVATNQQNGTRIPSTSVTSLSPKERRPLKRPSSAPVDTLEDYRKRKLAILVKEHIVRVELMKAQTEYYRTKTDLMVKHSCTRPSNPPQKLPSHSQPIFPGNS